ncbi:MAG: hypothetical protein RIR70_2256 [Pseudomonadota bacterium]|jgi:hypothetical protein
MNVDLFVTTGPNRGAYVPISSGRHVVGASDDADIVLEGAPDTGALIFEVAAGRVKVSPAAGAVARVDGRALGRGGVTLQPGMGIEFGENELRVFWGGDIADGASVGEPARRGWGLRMLGILVVLVGTAIFLAEIWGQDLRKSAASGENGGPSQKTPPSSPPVGTVDRPPGKSSRLPEPLSGGMLEAVEARVRSVLRGTGLTGKLEGGRLVVTGSVLTAKDEKRLESMIAEVKPYIDVDVSGVRGLGGGNPTPQPTQVVAPARIVAVNIASGGPAKSYFETEDGARYFEGAIFGQGYVVSEIRPTAVAMEKGGQRVEYPLVGR